MASQKVIGSVQKLAAFLFFAFGAQWSHAETVLVPLSKFDNDSQQLTNSRVLEFWGYHAADGDDNYQNTLRLRYYNPLKAGDWHGRIRFDTAYVANYNSNTSPDNSGQYSAGNTMVTVWGQDRTFLKPLGATVGARVTFPFGNNGQWAVGPQLGWTFVPELSSKLHVTDFSPLIRYMYGFDTKNNSIAVNSNQPALQRNLQLFPTLGFQLSPNTTLRFWDENGMAYNSAGGGWFVPIDAMLMHRLTKHWVVSVGASKQVVQTFRQYDWMTYGKVSLNF
ncbi:MAG: hypothetical protein Q8R65_01240 [Polynucleobacter sp.]|nr:hypothetical protein [Polynucleobacter sp.]MDZ4057094.1 hypothetical protein [Polynucleobacter sp.]